MPRRRKPIHTARFDRCVEDVKRSGTASNPYAVCSSELGERKSILKAHRRNPRKRVKRQRRANPREWVVLAQKRNGRPLFFTGDRFVAGAAQQAARFGSRNMAANTARHLKRSYASVLQGYRVKAASTA